MKLFIELKENQKEIKLLYPGKFNHGLYGNFEVTETDLAHAVENFENHKGVRLDESGTPELPANYQHSGSDRNPENAKAAGWIKKLFMRGKELYASIEWTARALEYIKNKEFRYISPEFSHDWQDENGEKQGFTVLGVALTNIPFLKKGQTAIAFTDEYIFVGETENNNNNNLVGAGEMEEKKEIVLDEKVQEEIKKLQETNTGLSDQVKNLEGEKAETEKKLTEAEAKITEYEKNLTDSEKQVKELSEKVTEIEKKMAGAEAEQAITKFIAAGKVLPKQKEFWLKRYVTDKDTTVAYLTDSPAVVNMGEQGSAGDAKEEEKKYDDPTKELNDRAVELMAKEKIDMKDAVNKVLAENKELREAYFSYQK